MPKKAILTNKCNFERSLIINNYIGVTMNSIFDKPIQSAEYFGLNDGQIIIENSKNVPIADIIDGLAEKSFKKLCKGYYKNENKQADAAGKLANLKSNLVHIKEKAEKHNATWSVWFVNQFGLDKYSYFAKLRTCNISKIENILSDMEVIDSLESEGFGNLINKIIKFKNDPKASSLFLGGLNLDRLPSIIFSNSTICNKIINLNLSKNNFTSIPEEIGQLKKLLDLDLSENKLSSLPEWIENLVILERLYLSKNEFEEVPTQLIGLMFKKLKYIDLDGNKIDKKKEDHALGVAPMAQASINLGYDDYDEE